MNSLRRSATIPRPLPGTPPVPVVPAPSRFTLENGLRVVALARSDLPQVAARLVLPAGSAVDPADAPGTACLVGSLLTEGTQELSAIELNERIDNLGASLGARASHDFAEVDLRLLAETLEEGLDLLASVVVTPSFPSREVERLRAESLDALEARLDEPANIADDHVDEAVFGPGHPYGRLPIGTLDGVRRLRRDTMVEFHRARYRPEGSVLVIVGDFDVDRMRRRLESAFQGWAGLADRIEYPSIPSELNSPERSVFVESEESGQSELRIAGLGLPRSSPDWIPAAVANYILGGSTITGRLGANLREDKGWTYGVRSGFSAGVHPGGWVVETAVGAEVTARALDEIEAELRRMVEEPISEEELARASEALILSLPRAFETPGRTVSRLATVEAYGLDPDYWERFPQRVHQVTVDDVARIAAECFAPERLVRVTVGPRSPVGS
ncbi:MAG: pitrilysin family protein [Gemmatimonadota bacterium]